MGKYLECRNLASSIWFDKNCSMLLSASMLLWTSCNYYFFCHFFRTSHFISTLLLFHFLPPISSLQSPDAYFSHLSHHTTAKSLKWPNAANPKSTHKQHHPSPIKHKNTQLQLTNMITQNTYNQTKSTHNMYYDKHVSKHQMKKNENLTQRTQRRWKASSVSGVGDGLTTPSEASVFWSLPRLISF